MHAEGFEFTRVGSPPRTTTRELTCGPDDVLIEVAGCGLCHTDLSYAYDGVPTRQALPLILGHEISGRVVEAGALHQDRVGQRVIVPAVIPCGECSRCKAGREMTCTRQVMPGNDRDGGFATHVVVPGRGLCAVPEQLGIKGLELAHLAVIADAVSTPFQAIERSGLVAGQVAVISGLGGVGGYAAQLARARGAFVIGLDVDPDKLSRSGLMGCHAAFNPKEHPERQLRMVLQGTAREAGFDPDAWCLYECSGTAAGQRTAFGLLSHGATLMVVGFTMDKVELRLSNLMAFDARAMGIWGCPPSLYPKVLDAVLTGRVDLLNHTRLRPLSTLPEAFIDVHTHRVRRRQVLVPNA